MSAPAPKADFKLVLLSVNPAQVQSVVAELTELFPINQKTALGAVRNAPIVLVGGMTQQMAANLRSHLVRLHRLGAQLKLTSDPVGKLKQFRWPAPPPAALRPANLFTCPACGERFLVQRAQAATITPVAHPPAEAAAPPAPEPAAEAPPAAPAEEADAAIPEAEPVELSAAEEEVIPEAEAVETEVTEVAPAAAAAPPPPPPPPPPTPVGRDELAELTGFLDSILKESPKGAASAPGPEAPAPEAPAPAPPPPPPSAPPPAPKPVPPPPQQAAASAEEPKTLVRVMPQAAPPKPKPIEAKPQPAAAQAPPPAPVAVPVAAVTAESPTQPLAPPPALPKPRPMEIKPQTQVFPKPSGDAATLTMPRAVAAPRATAPPPKPAPAPEPPAGARYDVSVAKVRGHEANILVQLLVERAGMAPEEAQRQCERMVVMVCKGGSASEADEWRRSLEKIGLKPRIRKH